jgi:GxxExxY protein
MEEELDPLTKRIIGCAIALHRHIGPGLLESVYQTGLGIEMRFQEIAFEKEKSIDVTYRGFALGELRPDFIVQNEVVVEVKCASSHDRVFDAQVLTYLRLTGLRKGLLLNFGRPTLKDGIKRFAL